MESTEINDKKIELNIKSPLKQTDKPKIVIVHAFGCVSVDEKKQIYKNKEHMVDILPYLYHLRGDRNFYG